MKRTTGGWLTRRSVAPWDDTEPIRAEVFGRERFEQHAVSLADSHMVVDRPEGRLHLEPGRQRLPRFLNRIRTGLTPDRRWDSVTSANVRSGGRHPEDRRVGGTTALAGDAWPRRVERIELDGADTTERNGVTPPADGEEHHVHVVMGPA